MTQGPRRLALLVATSHYDDPAFEQLRGATGDVEALKKVLADPSIGEFEIAGSLTDRAKPEVEEAIAEFFSSGRPQDLLLLYLSGHGVLSENRKHWYFATANTKRRNLDTTALWDEWLKARMANSRSNSIVLILDCCHSGAFIEGRRAKGDREVHVEDHFSTGGAGRVTLTASTALEYAFEAEATAQDLGSLEPGSLFTKHLVKGLDSRAADVDMDGHVSIDELFRYVEKKLQAELPRQTPGRGGESFGPIWVAHGRRTFLGPEAWAAMTSKDAALRQGMVAVLLARRQKADQQPKRDHDERLTEIDGALRRLAYEDESAAVRETARAALDGVLGRGPPGIDPATSTTPARLTAPPAEPPPAPKQRPFSAETKPPVAQAPRAEAKPPPEESLAPRRSSRRGTQEKPRAKPEPPPPKRNAPAPQEDHAALRPQASAPAPDSAARPGAHHPPPAQRRAKRVAGVRRAAGKLSQKKNRRVAALLGAALIALVVVILVRGGGTTSAPSTPLIEMRPVGGATETAVAQAELLPVSEQSDSLGNISLDYKLAKGERYKLVVFSDPSSVRRFKRFPDAEEAQPLTRIVH